MGVVFRARDALLGRDVALKCPRPDLGADPVTRRRFLRESRAACRISHPTIVPVYEVFEDRDLPWIAMEYIDGVSLTAALSSGDPLPVEAILQHTEDLTDALRAAHAKGVLHRDLKPGNVMIGRDGRARLTDFGLARFFVAPDEASEATTDSDQLTREGKVVGTPAYMSPEQAVGEREVDARADIYALGVVGWQMLAGELPFKATNTPAMMMKHLSEAPPPLAMWRKKLFILMSRNAQSATTFFNLPPNRVVEMGAQIQF
jgi:serine/threonine-protein kinase